MNYQYNWVAGLIKAVNSVESEWVKTNLTTTLLQTILCLKLIKQSVSFFQDMLAYTSTYFADVCPPILR